MSYTHYPMISTDMLNQIGKGAQYNNSQEIEGSFFFRCIKRVYYYVLMFFYQINGRFANEVATNSSWTNDHIVGLWGGKPTKIFPPCDTRDPFDTNVVSKRENLMISFAQFRPEKDHQLQLHVW